MDNNNKHDIDNFMLRSSMQRFRAEAERLRKLADDCEARANDYEAELERREIEALPLKIGDKLLITSDLFPKYAPYMPPDRDVFIATIDDFGSYGGDLRAWCGSGGISIEEAIRMRAAYLADHESEV